LGMLHWVLFVHRHGILLEYCSSHLPLSWLILLPFQFKLTSMLRFPWLSRLGSPLPLPPSIHSDNEAALLFFHHIHQTSVFLDCKFQGRPGNISVTAYGPASVSVHCDWLNEWINKERELKDQYQLWGLLLW
jgi:hypothetical protein